LEKGGEKNINSGVSSIKEQHQEEFERGKRGIKPPKKSRIPGKARNEPSTRSVQEGGNRGEAKRKAFEKLRAKRRDFYPDS